MKRILIGCSIRQDDDRIIERYARSLSRLEIPEGYEIYYHFVVHNQTKREGVIITKYLPTATFETAFLDTGYDHATHRWPNKALAYMGDVKSHLLERAVDKGHAYIFLVDSDLLLHPKTLKQLLSDEKDIVATIFWTRFMTQAGKVIEYEGPNCWQWHPYTVPQEMVENDFALWRKPGCYQVGGTGGAILISREVAEKVNYRSLYNLSPGCGEDRHFSIKAAAAGFKLWVDTTYPAYHLYHIPEDLEGVEAWEAKAYGGTAKEPSPKGTPGGLSDKEIKDWREKARTASDEEITRMYNELYTGKWADLYKHQEVIDLPIQDGLPEAALPPKYTWIAADIITRGPGNILELGFGRGHFLFHMACLEYDVTGVDCRATTVEYCQQKAAQVTPAIRNRLHFVQGLAEHIGGLGQFDSIVMADLLEHLRDPLAVLSNVLSHLVPGGRAYISTPIGANFDSPEHLWQFNNADGIRKTAAAAGCDMRLEEICANPYNPDGEPTQFRIVITKRRRDG